MNYNFIVPSLVINSTRSLITDTDYASLGVVTLDPNGKKVNSYGPISLALGNRDEGFVSLGMALTNIDVPDGGSMGVVFTVMNKGWWGGEGDIIDALNTVCSGLIGALGGGQLAGVSQTTQAQTADGANTTITQATAIPAWEAALVVAGILVIMEAVKVIFADCDGWVVNGTIKLGRTELDQLASKSVWNMTSNYPGSDSPVGCGHNSDYTVNYQVVASSVEVTVPKVTNLDPNAALGELHGAGLNGAIQVVEHSNTVDRPTITAQNPSPGALVLPGTTVLLVQTDPKSGPPL